MGRTRRVSESEARPGAISFGAMTLPGLSSDAFGELTSPFRRELLIGTLATKISRYSLRAATK
jgi:hypothetical protein